MQDEQPTIDACCDCKKRTTRTVWCQKSRWRQSPLTGYRWSMSASICWTMKRQLGQCFITQNLIVFGSDLMIEMRAVFNLAHRYKEWLKAKVGNMRRVFCLFAKSREQKKVAPTEERSGNGRLTTPCTSIQPVDTLVIMIYFPLFNTP